MNSPLGGVKPSWDQLRAFLILPLLYHDWCLVRTAPLWTTTPSSATPWERVSWLLFGLWNFPFSVWCSGCLELFPNSHLRILCLNYKNICLKSTSVCIEQPPTWLSREPSDLNGLESHGPLSQFWDSWLPIKGPGSPTWSFRELSDLSGADQGDPLLLCPICPLRV